MQLILGLLFNVIILLLKVPEAEGLYLIKVAIVVAAVEVDSFVVMSIVNMIAP